MGRKKEEKVYPKLHLVPRIINAAVAGTAGAIATYPLDMAKTRLQSQTVGPHGEVVYKSMYDCIRKVGKYEGMLGIYRGVLIEIMFLTPEKIVKLVANDFFRYHFRDQNYEISLPWQMLAGGLAGIMQISISTPRGLLKIQLQDTGRRKAEAIIRGNWELLKKIQKREEMTMFGLAKKIVQRKGIRGLYRGIYPTAMRDILFNITYFPSFFWLNAHGPRKKDDSGEAVWWWSFVAGVITGAGAAFLVTPADVIKTRLQMDATKFKPKYKNTFHCFSKTLKREGWRAFYRGGSCRVAEIAPLFGIIQSIYYLGIGEHICGVKQVKAV